VWNSIKASSQLWATSEKGKPNMNRSGFSTPSKYYEVSKTTFTAFWKRKRNKTIALFLKYVFWKSFQKILFDRLQF
jgi:hypothetical protein